MTSEKNRVVMGVSLFDNEPTSEQRGLARAWVQQDKASETLTDGEREIAAIASAHGFAAGLKSAIARPTRAVLLESLDNYQSNPAEVARIRARIEKACSSDNQSS